jgi:hypothetical protein
MKIEIESKHTQDGSEYYEWNLIDGPDGIDHARGYATDLIVAFSKLIEWRERISADYAAEVTADLNTLNEFSQQNETDCGPTG